MIRKVCPYSYICCKHLKLIWCAVVGWLGNGGKSKGSSQHHASLRNLRSDDACQFLLENSKFTQWYHGTGPRQLAILGAMGSGKTVAMSFLIDELRRRNQHQLPQPKVCFHYCRDDGTGEAVHVLSSLILSLLQQLPGLKKGFVEWYQQATSSGIDPATDFKTLEEWLANTLQTLDRPLIFTIDGLDECDKQSRNRLLQSLRNLTRETPRLKILLSSRPDPAIMKQLRGVSTICVPSDDATRDRLIVKKTVETRLTDLPEQVKALTIEELSRLAQGSAIWTKMTVELIEIRKISALGPLRAFLKELPQPERLSELYANLFSRYTGDDPENQKLAIAALEILAVARRPLSILELGWAASLGTATDAVTRVGALAELADPLRILNLIRPFVVPVYDRDMTKRQVKLVHQSVKEFIVQQWAAPEHAQPQQRIERLEARLLNICIRYLLLPEMGNEDLFSDVLLAIGELPHGSDLFTDDDQPNEYDHYCSWEAWEEDMIHYDPVARGFGEFFVYASCYWTEHLGAVSTETLLPSLDDIELVCQAGSKRLQNWILQNCRPDCAIKPRFPFDPSLYDPLSIVSLYGSEALLQRMLDRADVGNTDRYLPDAAMAAADQILQFGDLSRLELLWRSKLGPQIRNRTFAKLAVKQWSMRPFDKQRSRWDVVFGLIDGMFDLMVKEGWDGELLRAATQTGCTPMVQLLSDKVQQISEASH
ncbi:uncharacterized protein THITE_2037841 [Thermothielavioides terrestris NRRL 8126]|uniref:NACHT domain-containing protein n=1 Tax=Thermothielavioides terrestris (strain ATCC 38088 / NRRL 8126) TaxID=578455 RepID=G2QQS7_THETT|nr:uncharacterized protein THITE_2037841 [Thermothielavioides terrestris NRRL 8126]AEO63287.1 hypothetical protein THITE_2037841 [Thermothielavioides terrestris NRRL 8126]